MSEQLPTHPCPVDGCGSGFLPYDRLMCPYHWRLVPKKLQRMVYAHWAGGVPTHLYPHVRRQAIEAASAGGLDNPGQASPPSFGSS